MKKDKRIKIGVVGVDSGQLMIVDPCYIQRENSIKNYDRNCEKQYEQILYELGHEGEFTKSAVVMSSELTGCWSAKRLLKSCCICEKYYVCKDLKRVADAQFDEMTESIRKKTAEIEDLRKKKQEYGR